MRGRTLALVLLKNRRTHRRTPQGKKRSTYDGKAKMSETKPTADELAKGLGKLCSCFSVPASDSKHAVNLVRPIMEIETIYFEALDLLRRFYPQT